MAAPTRFEIRTLAQEILRNYNGAGILTMLEATNQARRELGLPEAR